MAHIKKETLVELILNTIMSSFRYMRDSGQIKGCPVSGDSEFKLSRLILNEENDYALRVIIQLNKEMQNGENISRGFVEKQLIGRFLTQGTR